MPLKIRPNAIEQDQGEFIFPGIRVTEDIVLVSGSGFGDFNLLDPQGILRIANDAIIETISPSSGLATDMTLRAAELNLIGGGNTFIELTSNNLKLHTFRNFFGPPAIDLIVDSEGADNAFRIQGTGGFAAFNAVPIESQRLSIDGNLGISELGSDPDTPPSGWGNIFARSDGHVYWKNDSGTVFILTSGTAGPAGESLWGQTGTTIYYNDGRVGVGTSTPTGVFHAAGSLGSWHIDDDGSALFGNRAGINYFGAIDPAGTLFFTAGGDFGTPSMYMTTGFIGIGASYGGVGDGSAHLGLMSRPSPQSLTNDMTGLVMGNLGGSEMLAWHQYLDYQSGGAWNADFYIRGLNTHWEESSDSWVQDNAAHASVRTQLWSRQDGEQGGWDSIFSVAGSTAEKYFLSAIMDANLRGRVAVGDVSFRAHDLLYAALTVIDDQDYSAVGGYGALAALRVQTSGSAPGMAAIQMGKYSETTWFGSFNTNISFDGQSGTWGRVKQEYGGVIFQNEHREAHTRNALWIYGHDDAFYQFHEYHLHSGTAGQHTIKFNPLAGDIDFSVYDDTDVALFVRGSDGYVGIMQNVPLAPVHQMHDASGSSSVDEILRREVEYSGGTVANGHGMRESYYFENATGSSVLGMYEEHFLEDVSVDDEDAASKTYLKYGGVDRLTMELGPGGGSKFYRYAPGGASPQASAVFTTDKSEGVILDGFGPKMAFRVADNTGSYHWCGGLSYGFDFTNQRSEAQLIIKSGVADKWATTQVLAADHAALTINPSSHDRDFIVNDDNGEAFRVDGAAGNTILPEDKYLQFGDFTTGSAAWPTKPSGGDWLMFGQDVPIGNGLIPYIRHAGAGPWGYPQSIISRDLGDFRTTSSWHLFGPAYYIAGMRDSTGLTAGAPAIDRYWSVPFVVNQRFVVTSIGFYVTGVGGAGSVARVGIYDSTEESDLRPRRLILDGGEKATNGVGTKVTTGLSVELIPGRVYWATYLCGVGAPTIKALNASSVFPIYGFTTIASANVGVGINMTQSYGALIANHPTSGGVMDNVDTIPAIYMSFN